MWATVVCADGDSRSPNGTVVEEPDGDVWVDLDVSGPAGRDMGCPCRTTKSHPSKNATKKYVK